MNKLCSLANNIQIVQGILRNSPASCCRSCPPERAESPTWGGACGAGRGCTRRSPRGGGGERGGARRRGRDRRGGGRRGKGRSQRPRPCGWLKPSSSRSRARARWPLAGSVRLGGPCAGGALLRPPEGDKLTEQAPTAQVTDTRHCSSGTWSTPCPLRPWGPTAILRQGPLSPGSRAGRVPTGPCRRRALHLPARGPQGRWAPRGGTRGLRVDKGTSPPSRPPRGPWTRGCRRASCAGGAPEVGERGRGTSSGEGRQSPRGLAHPAPLPLSSRTGRLSLPPLPRASCPRGAPLPTAPSSRPSGCPALPCAGSGAEGGAVCAELLERGGRTNPHDGRFPSLRCKLALLVFFKSVHFHFDPKCTQSETLCFDQRFSLV